MNDLDYVFYNAKIMLIDTMDIPDPDTELAHRRLCDYIWAHGRPLKADDKFLRQITRVAEPNWGRVKRGLLDKGWLLLEDWFLHRGAIALLNKAQEKFIENHNRTAEARGVARMVGLTDSVTGIITSSVTAPVAVPVTPAVTPSVTPGQRNEGKGRKGKESDYSLSSKVSLGGLGGIVQRIITNRDGWAYDNCKVQVRDFTAAQVSSVLRPYVDRLTGTQMLAAWTGAVLKAHRDAVDGMIIKNAAASCVDDFKRRLAEAAGERVTA